MFNNNKDIPGMDLMNGISYLHTYAFVEANEDKNYEGGRVLCISNGETDRQALESYINNYKSRNSDEVPIWYIPGATFYVLHLSGDQHISGYTATEGMSTEITVPQEKPV